ncbi:MAG: exodeoxyribonuclease VII large subunit [Chloroflexi bacterium]|nr:exodeoxyribonuclease VII large subunit [Chloroflexota bacterium]
MAVYTVSQVTAYIRELLEADPLLTDLYVLGEVSNLRVSATGHSYFTLKDGQAVLNCVMFKGQTGANLLANGTSVSTHGHLSFYEPRGSADFVVDLAMPEGVGELALELEQLKMRLGAEGLFEESRKRPLPEFPQVIGVVTSPSGAVFHDIQNVIQRRYPLVELLLAPSQVQGDRAAPNLVAAIEGLNRDGRSDLIIVARGGGSLEELWPFNEETVARAIYASRIPVVSAVGHETDVTIADLVADLRAPTPSAAAELVVPDRNVLRQDLAQLALRCHRAISLEMQGMAGEVSTLTQRLSSGLPDWETWRRRIDDLGRVVNDSLAKRLQLTQIEVGGLQQRLAALNPAAILRRGFSVVQLGQDGQVVTSAKQVQGGDALTITVSDGSIPATAGGGAKAGSRGKRRKVSVQTPSMERLL